MFINYLKVYIFFTYFNTGSTLYDFGNEIEKQ